MDNLLHLFVDEGLWIVLDALVCTSQCRLSIKSIIENFLERNENYKSRSRIIHHCFQAQWLAVKQLKKCGNSQQFFYDFRAKRSQLNQLLIALDEKIENRFIVEFFVLLEKISSELILHASNTSSLSNHNLQVLSELLCRKPLVVLSIVKNLFSPCLPHFAESDASLTRICNEALYKAIEKLEKDSNIINRGVLLKLLSAVIDNSDCLPKLLSLVTNKVLSESELHLALIVRGGNPPSLLQNFCALEDDHNKYSFPRCGQFSARDAFHLQSKTKEHWLLNLVSTSYEVLTSENGDTDKNLAIVSQAPTSLFCPVFLLLAWDQQNCDIETISLLTDACKQKNCDLMFERLGFLLETRASVVKWIKFANKSCSDAVKYSVLNKFEKSSTLRVLFETTCLTTSGSVEIESLLMKSKTDNDDWQLTTFQGFCVIAEVTELIWSSVEENSYEKKGKIKGKTTTDTDISEDTLLKNLGKIRCILEKLNPLTFRLEILENLFSLLFLRYENLHVEDAPSDSGADDDEEDNNFIAAEKCNIVEHNVDSDIHSVDTKHPCKMCYTRSVKEKNESTCILNNRGFICSVSIARAILNCLSECMVQCSASFYNQRRNIVNESSNVNVEKQINTLLQLTAEALLRLELVEDLPTSPHCHLNFEFEPQPVYPSTASSSDDDDTVEDRKRSERVQRKMSYTSRHSRSDYTDRSSESSSNTTGSATSSGGKRPSHHRTRALKRLPNESDSIIRLLLAKPASLVVLCLSRGDINKAQQVIQVFQISNSLKNEANFLEIYEKLATEISVERNVNKQTFPITPVPSSSLMAVSKAALAYKNVIGISSSIEAVLTTAPRVHGLDRLIAEYPCAASLLSGLNSKVMASCDAALTLGNSREISLSLLDIVSQHLTVSNSAQELKLENSRKRRVSDFMSTLIELFRNLCKFSLDDTTLALNSFLVKWEIPLKTSLINEFSCLWTVLQNVIFNFVEEYNNSNSKGQIVAVQKLIKVCGESFSYYESRGVVSADRASTPYLQNIFWYLQTLSSLVSKCSHEMEDKFNPFSILNEGITDLLGRLIFDIGAPLSHIERVTARLQLNLLRTVVSSCCPTINLIQHSSAISCIPGESAWAKISLNADSTGHSGKSISSPIILASSLLSKLLDALKSCCTSPLLTHDNLFVASHNSDVIKILNETSKFINVDLDALKHDLEKVSFLINIINLLLLHGLIVLGSNWGLVSPHYTERMSAYNCVGYHVGQMGFVSISELLTQLLGSHMQQELCVEKSEEQYWTINEKRAYFCLSQGTIQSPVIEVIGAETVEQQINTAISSYLNNNLRVEGSIGEGCFALIIPRLVLFFLGLQSPSSLEHAQEARDEPGSPQQVLFHQVTYLARDCTTHLPQIIDFFKTYTAGALKMQLEEWVDAWTFSSENNTDLILTVEEMSLKFGILLSSEMEVVSSESMQLSSVSGETSSADIGWENRILSQSIHKFLEHHCWLVSLLAQRLRQNIGEFKRTTRTAYLDRLTMNCSPSLSLFTSGNVTLALLESFHNMYRNLWPVLDNLLSAQRETECVQLILSLPESAVVNDIKLQMIRDIILYQIASQPPTPGIDKPWCLALSLGTAELRAKCVLNSVKFWPGPESIDILKAMLGETNLTPSIRSKISNLLHRVTIYQQVHQVLCYYQANKPSLSGGWYEVCKLSESNPGQVLQSLIEYKQYRLCLPWAQLHGIPHRAQHLVNASFISLLLETEIHDFSAAEKLLSSIPIPQAISICRRLLASLTSLSNLKFVVKFALERCQSWLQESPELWSRLQLWSVGLSVLALLPTQEQQRDRVLASKPHLLLEQLLMNSRLAILDDALRILRTTDLSAVRADSPSQPIAVDTMLRQYATKALDFRVSRRAVIPEVVSAGSQIELLQSLSTDSTSSSPVPFVMPVCPPSKAQWVPNDEATECMCCVSVSFSMFNRRHHCRRCGRVICGTCSGHRAKVEGYGDLPVRICDDCNKQMHNQILGEDQQTILSPEFSTTSSQYSTEWKLLGEEPHDGTVREEFAFEHAPSVGLCLSILALHSEHTAAQPRFLLDAADQMLQLLIPSTPGFINPELDYSLVIRMARGLVVAAKVRYAKAALNSGVAHCDRLLEQVDLLTLLVRSGCTSLLPAERLPLRGHALRHLRDRLVAAELYPLALEVSTKTGLECGGVWVAWGKACLRTGRWQEAREHFSHCLQTPGSVQEPCPRSLLMEIVDILDEGNYPSDSSVVKQQSPLVRPSAVAVLHTLSSLSAVADGKFSTISASNDNLHFYNESLYYLQTYSSPTAILSFFVSRSKIADALHYVIDKSVEPDVFAEALYKPCLKQGIIDQLHEEMKNIDSTLEIWKDILLHVGHLLERQGLLHSLYELQLYANDLVRAAMTCIRFYHANARCYSELSPEYLHEAQRHLEKELELTQWKLALKESYDESPTKSLSVSIDESSSSREIQLPLKLPARQLHLHISTICRQLEVAKFLQHCENNGCLVMKVAAEVRKEAHLNNVPLLPTLFENSTVRAVIAAMLIVCGRNAEEGFGLAFRVIQEYHLRPLKAYSIAAHWLTNKSKWHHLEQLVSCIRSSGSPDSALCSDELLLHCVRQLIEQREGIGQSDNLLKLIIDQPTKIQAHLLCGQLKSAYLLAVKLGRSGDVQAVLLEAERLNQSAMIRICKQWLSKLQKDLN